MSARLRVSCRGAMRPCTRISIIGRHAPMSIRRSLIIAAVMCALTAMSAHADSRFHYGARAGVNASAFAGDYATAFEPETRNGPYVALAGEYAFNSALSLRAEVAYSSNGGRTEGDPMLGTEFNYDYLELPLLVHAKISDTKVTPFLELGPTLGFALKGVIHTTLYPPFAPWRVGPPVRGEEREFNVRSSMKDVDAGFGAGLGVEFPAGALRVGVDARYVRGFSDLFEPGTNRSSIKQSWTIALSVLR